MVLLYKRLSNVSAQLWAAVCQRWLKVWTTHRSVTFSFTGWITCGVTGVYRVRTHTLTFNITEGKKPIIIQFIHGWSQIASCSRLSGFTGVLCQILVSVDGRSCRLGFIPNGCSATKHAFTLLWEMWSLWYVMCTSTALLKSERSLMSTLGLRWFVNLMMWHQKEIALSREKLGQGCSAKTVTQFSVFSNQVLSPRFERQLTWTQTLILSLA